MRLDAIDKIKETGLFPCLVKEGIISFKVNYYSDVYYYFKIRMVANDKEKNKKMQSITETSDAFKCCERSVWNAIYFMEK